MGMINDYKVGKGKFELLSIFLECLRCLFPLVGNLEGECVDGMLFDLVNVGKLFKKEMVLAFPVFPPPCKLYHGENRKIVNSRSVLNTNQLLFF